MGKKHKKHKSKKHAETEVVEEEVVVKEERILPKLVLKMHKEEKINEESAASSDDYKRESHKDRHKKKKKKEKKHKHKHDESKKSRKREHAAVEDELEPPVKKIHIKMLELPVEEPPPPPPPEVDSNGEKKLLPLQLCLENLHRTLQRKDSFGIFTYPVTDAIAPNYSQIVTNPMDFSTMMCKIERNNYPTIRSFKDDFILMCKNAMTYNTPDTIYFKAAEKLYNLGMKTLSEDKIRKIRKSIGIIGGYDYAGNMEGVVDELGMIDVDTFEDDDMNERRRFGREPQSNAENHEEITAQVVNAAKQASERLRNRYKDSKMGFLRKDTEGNTSLAILNPDSVEGPHSLPVNLGKLSGRPTSGSASLLSVKDDKKNKVIPVSYLAYGPYGSFGPTYDSSLSNITKEESRLLLDTYGSETGIHYAKSLQSFVKDSTSFAQDLVDRFLDALTDGSHTRWIRRHGQTEKPKVAPSKLAEKKQSETGTAEGVTGKVATPAAAVPENKENDASSNIDLNSLMTLNNDGIDVSFLKNLLDPTKSRTLSERDELQTKLDENAQFLNNLKNAQDERLLKRPQDARTPSEKEILIAENITGNIKELLTKVRPGDVVSQEGVRKALGIGTSAESIAASGSEKSAIIVDSLSYGMEETSSKEGGSK